MDKPQSHMQSVHEPVLLHEVVRELIQDSRIKNRSVPWYLDGTLGGAGHALAIAKAYGGHLNIIGLDRDPKAIERAKATLESKAEKVILAKADYRNLDKVLDENGVARVDMILLDLGISSDELEHSGRGFTFQKDEPLMMTFGDPSDHPFTARDIVNGWDEPVIADIIFGYGEERYARRIARQIVSYRAKKKIETSGELAEIVKSAVPRSFRKIHPATKTFQALRIAVNDELNALREGLKRSYDRLSPHGRFAVITFHSLEDRIVKNFFNERSKDEGECRASMLTKKPIVASEQEQMENPRSRSAKLRAIEKVLNGSKVSQE